MIARSKFDLRLKLYLPVSSKYIASVKVQYHNRYRIRKHYCYCHIEIVSEHHPLLAQRPVEQDLRQEDQQVPHGT